MTLLHLCGKNIKTDALFIVIRVCYSEERRPFIGTVGALVPKCYSKSVKCFCDVFDVCEEKSYDFVRDSDTV